MAKAQFVLDITIDNFQAEVLEKSKRVPVILDFWAAWCGPCRTLGPVLERLAEEYAGGFVLGKIDTEREAELAYQFGVQSIPFVVAFVAGRPADAFSGALAETEVRRFLQRVGVKPASGPKTAPEPAVSASASALEKARQSIRRGDVAGAEKLLAEIPEEDDQRAAATRLAEGLEFFRGSSQAAAGPAAEHVQRALEAFRAQRVRPALDELLASLRVDRGYQGQLARRAMVAIFALLGDDDPLTDEYRRQLAHTLY